MIRKTNSPAHLKGIIASVQSPHIFTHLFDQHCRILQGSLGACFGSTENSVKFVENVFRAGTPLGVGNLRHFGFPSVDLLASVLDRASKFVVILIT